MKQLLYFTILFVLLTIQTTSAQKKQLYGTWQSPDEMIIFDEETATIGGIPFSYQALGNVIKVFDEYGSTLEYKYKINGNTLILSAEGETYTFVKVSDKNVLSDSQNMYDNYNNHQQNVQPYGNNTGANSNLYGTFCSYSSSGYNSAGSYSTTNRISFDGGGNFTYGSESSYSGGGDGYYNNSGGEHGTYIVQGNMVILTFSDGSQYQVSIHFVQDSGEITELMYDGTLYAKALCE